MASIVFMGTPDFAVPTLEALIRHHTVVGVVTQPDRPAGRGGQIQQSPVKRTALAAGIPVFQPEKIRKPDAIAALRAWDADCYVVAAFGQILPQALLDIPPFGSINVHGSILPRWRGAAPIQAAIRAGDAETGVTIMKMDAGLDTGAMILVRRIPIAPDETGGSLHDKMALLGAEAILPALDGYLAGTLIPIPQPVEGVTIAPRIDKSEGHIDWSQPANVIERLIRAFTPAPGTYTFLKGQRLKLHGGVALRGTGPIGGIARLDGRIVIGTGQGLFAPSLVQLEGRKAVSIDDFANGYGVDLVGTVLA